MNKSVLPMHAGKLLTVYFDILISPVHFSLAEICRKKPSQWARIGSIYSLFLSAALFSVARRLFGCSGEVTASIFMHWMDSPQIRLNSRSCIECEGQRKDWETHCYVLINILELKKQTCADGELCTVPYMLHTWDPQEGWFGDTSSVHLTFT